MAKRAGAFKSEKRRKELSRQKKQEEKRQRRLNKGVGGKDENEAVEAGGEGEKDESVQGDESTPPEA